MGTSLTKHVLVSACLLGIECRYDGRSRPNEELVSTIAGMHVVPVCPEQLGGLATPRPPAAIQGGDGFDVLASRAGVFINRDAARMAGREVTSNFVHGARQCVKLAKILGVRRCYLKARSPS